MMSTKVAIVATVLLCVLAVIFIIIVRSYTRKMDEMKKQLESLRKTADNAIVVIEKERENEKRKDSFKSGDSESDFNNSVELMQNLANGRAKN